MFKAVSKGIIVGLMLLAYIGQSMALSLTMPCDASLDKQFSSASERIQHNDADHIQGDNSAQCCDIDCCDPECICIASACSSSAFLDVLLRFTTVIAKSDAVLKQPLKQPQSIASLPYRPPIFC